MTLRDEIRAQDEADGLWMLIEWARGADLDQPRPTVTEDGMVRFSIGDLRRFRIAERITPNSATWLREKCRNAGYLKVGSHSGTHWLTDDQEVVDAIRTADYEKREEAAAAERLEEMVDEYVADQAKDQDEDYDEEFGAQMFKRINEGYARVKAKREAELLAQLPSLVQQLNEMRRDLGYADQEAPE